jgi:hypothetical protein
MHTMNDPIHWQIKLAACADDRPRRAMFRASLAGTKLMSAEFKVYAYIQKATRPPLCKGARRKLAEPERATGVGHNRR